MKLLTRRGYLVEEQDSLHAAVRCGADQRTQLERLCRYITRPALANERLSRNAKGQVVLRLKSAYRDGCSGGVESRPESAYIAAKVASISRSAAFTISRIGRSGCSFGT